MIPKTIPAVLAALTAARASLNEAEAEALDAALAQASPVDRIVAAFDVLSAVPEPADDALIALVGCASLLAAFAWHGKGAAAAALLIERAAQIAALPQPVIVLPEPGP